MGIMRGPLVICNGCDGLIEIGDDVVTVITGRLYAVSDGDVPRALIEQPEPGEYFHPECYDEDDEELCEDCACSEPDCICEPPCGTPDCEGCHEHPFGAEPAVALACGCYCFEPPCQSPVEAPDSCDDACCETPSDFLVQRLRIAGFPSIGFSPSFTDVTGI